MDGTSWGTFIRRPSYMKTNVIHKNRGAERRRHLSRGSSPAWTSLMLTSWADRAERSRYHSPHAADQPLSHRVQVAFGCGRSWATRAPETTKFWQRGLGPGQNVM